MTIRITFLTIALFSLTACAGHTPLKAPCPAVAMLGASSCGPEQPINIASL